MSDVSINALLDDLADRLMLEDGKRSAFCRGILGDSFDEREVTARDVFKRVMLDCLKAVRTYDGAKAFMSAAPDEIRAMLAGRVGDVDRFYRESVERLLKEKSARRAL